MYHLLALLLALTVLAHPLPAAETAAPLPEKVQIGDSEPSYPAERARRVEAGKTLLDRGDLAGAKQEFDKAHVAEPTDPMPYFYLAVIAYRQGDFPVALRQAQLGLVEAEEAVRLAGKPGPELTQNLQRLQELYDTIKAKHDSVPSGQGNAVELLRGADEAYASGLLAKAATGYAQAFRADPAKGEAGLKAATLYADRLKNPLEAARLWQQVLAGGEPNASVARAELQSHRDVLDAVLQAGLARREQWRSQGPAEALQLAEAFPENTDLQVELALVYAFKGSVDDMTRHLQVASRLGLGLDEFRAKRDFINFFEVSGVDNPAGQHLAAFLRDAYADETIIAGIRDEVKRRYDEKIRLAREKAEKEHQAKLAKALKELTTWRNGVRAKVVAEVNALISARNNLEVEMANVQPVKKKTTRYTMTRHNSVSAGNGKYLFTFWRRDTTFRFSTGSTSPVATEDVISLPSFAPLRSMEAWPSSWEDIPKRVGESNPNSPIYSLPADPALRALCKEVRLNFNSPANIRRKSTTTYEYETSDGSTGYTNNSDYDASVSIPALLNDEEVARLQQLFGQLAKLDAAGDNLEKLRQLRAN